MENLDIIALAAALIVLGFLEIERIILRSARSRVSHVIHVNGTRGKSETTRLIAGALREGGFTVWAKTTGTEARLILPGGEEEPLRRIGGANVREQRNFLLRAAFGRVRRSSAAGGSSRIASGGPSNRSSAADRASSLASRPSRDVSSGVSSGPSRGLVIVAECMAVNPDAQEASTAFLRPDFLVLTNARKDHELELGSPEESVEVFLRGIPPEGFLVSPDPGLIAKAQDAARSKKARIIQAESRELGDLAFPDNVGSALAVAQALGVTEETALQGMRRHRPDPGAARLRRLSRTDGCGILILDALSANDPESTELALKRLRAARTKTGPLEAPRILVFAARTDRPDRSLAFARWAAGREPAFEQIYLLGRLPRAARLLFEEAARRAGTKEPSLGSRETPVNGPSSRQDPGLMQVHSPKVLLEKLRSLAPDSIVAATGNWRDLGPVLAAACATEPP